MNTDTKIIIGAVVASILIIIGASVVLSRNNGPKRENLGIAAMTIDKKEEDFGDMKVDEEKAATFTITNTSDAVLRIWGIATSCDCTFANVTIRGEKTGEFNMTMHTSGPLKNWIGEVPKGEKATLEVIYRPSVMPVSGPVSRQVRFATNDPKNAEVEVSVKANVL